MYFFLADFSHVTHCFTAIFLNLLLLRYSMGAHMICHVYILYICTRIQCMVDIYIRYTHTHTYILIYAHAYIHTHTHTYKHQTTTLKTWVSRCCTRPSLGAWLHTGDGVRNVCRTSSAGSPVRAFLAFFLVCKSDEIT